MFGAIAGVALLARRARTSGAHGDAGELAPLAVDELGPLEIPFIDIALPRVAAIDTLPGDAPASALERAAGFVRELARGVMDLTLPRGIRNNNPGNIRWLEQPGRRWRGMVANDGGNYAVFDDMANGVRALGKQLLKYQDRGLNTVREIIGTWAPPSENVTSAYVTAVAAALGVAPDDPIDVNRRLVELGRAIVKHENGGDFTTYQNPKTRRAYTAQEFAVWVRLA